MTTKASVFLEHHRLGRGSAAAALIVLNRPDDLNPIDGQSLAELDQLLDEIEADARVRTVLVTGAGRAFSAGGDLKKYVALQKDPIAFPKFVSELHRIFGRLRSLPVPVVALINGVTAAGGLELVLNCDFALIGATASVGDGHLNFGQMGGGGVLTLLPRRIGRARATELILSGRFLQAEEVVAWGIASRVVPDDELLQSGLDFAREVAAKSPLAVANAKGVLESIWSENASVESGLRYEVARNAYYCLTSFDAPEGLQAFREHRRPRFRGR
jgi:enoyl-CoA hydratase